MWKFYYLQDIIKNGIYSGIPYVGFVLATLIGGQLADYLRRKWLSTKTVRKLCTSIGNFIIIIIVHNYIF